MIWDFEMLKSIAYWLISDNHFTDSISCFMTSAQFTFLFLLVYKFLFCSYLLCFPFGE